MYTGVVLARTCFIGVAGKNWPAFALFSPPLKTRANFEFKPTAAAAGVRETVQVAQFVQCQLLN